MRGPPLLPLLIRRARPCRAGGGIDSRERDPGYHLIAGGRPTFERTVGFRAPLRDWLVRCRTKIGIGGYVGGVLIVTAIVLLLPMIALGESRIGGWLLGLLALLGLIPAMDMAVAIVNRVVTSGFGPTILPGLELRDGVTVNLRTMVVVPTLLTTQAALEEQIERLEVHKLASPEGEFYFALLSDWTDASTEHAEGDDALLDAAAEGIARLNSRYGPAPGGDRFLLLHRRRVWNEGQKQWIGWERKRGKLHELNRLLRGAGDTTFMAIGGRPVIPPPGVRYVITLDSDTRLPRETVRRLVGKMAHPLNHPRFDATTGRVVEGYAVLQPRVTPSLPIGREGSLFQRISSSMSGIDPYASAASDVYQDLFGEGSYTGKGIYDVDAFEAALAGRVPESTLLSHDLFEGTFARAGLASDIEVVEEFPSRYDVAAARQHRWARGDWQLLPWIFGRGDASVANRGTSALPLIGRWKMLDNLRRTLSAPASVMALLAGWTLSLHSAAVWTCFILSTIAVPTLLPVLAAIVPRRGRVMALSHLRAFGADLWLALSQTALAVTFLAHQAWSMTDAIGRTLVSSVREPAAFARMGHGSLREVQPSARPPRLLSADGRWCRHRHRCRDRRLVRRRRRLAGGGAARGAVDRIAGRRPMDKPIAARGGSVIGLGSRRARLEADRAPDVALFRDLRHGGGPHAAAGQFPGRPNAGTRPPDLAHKSRPLSSLRGQRPRLRMGGNNGDCRALGSNARNDEQPAALPWPFLQLV